MFLWKGATLQFFIVSLRSFYSFFFILDKEEIKLLNLSEQSSK